MVIFRLGKSLSVPICHALTDDTSQKARQNERRLRGIVRFQGHKWRVNSTVTKRWTWESTFGHLPSAPHLINPLLCSVPSKSSCFSYFLRWAHGQGGLLVPQRAWFSFYYHHFLYFIFFISSSLFNVLKRRIIPTKLHKCLIYKYFFRIYKIYYNIYEQN